MEDIYSAYDAKARFSEILRRVREGKTVIISYHGEPVAEVRPIGGRDEEVSRRLGRLEDRGVLVRAREREGRLGPVVRKPGALERFLDDRNA
jgi:prevent-host-death family protein